MSLRGRKNFLVALSISSSAGVPAIRGDAAFGRSRSACKHDLAAADACCDRTLSRLTAGLFSLRTGHASPYDVNFLRCSSTWAVAVVAPTKGHLLDRFVAIGATSLRRSNRTSTTRRFFLS